MTDERGRDSADCIGDGFALSSIARAGPVVADERDRISDDRWARRHQW
jgi:hypothetical protein